MTSFQIRRSDWRAELRAMFAAAGVHHRVLSRSEHWEREAAWRAVYGGAFAGRIRQRHDAKAIHEYLRQPDTNWFLVPFLSNVPGLPMGVRSQQYFALECDGPLLELDGFSGVEFFVSPPSLSWTFIRTHEDFCCGGPYFVRAEWVEESGARRRDRQG